LNDCTVFKVTLFAVVSDSVGTYAMWHFGTGVNPHAKPMTSSSMFFFWMIFGPGMVFGITGDRCLGRWILPPYMGRRGCWFEPRWM